VSQLLDRALGALFAVAVAGALLFGSVQVASGLAANHCPNDGSSMLGSCVSQQDCQTKCDQAHPGQSVMGVCDGMDCCNCLL
jgi:hypothetical protein